MNGHSAWHRHLVLLQFALCLGVLTLWAAPEHAGAAPGSPTADA